MLKLIKATLKAGSGTIAILLFGIISTKIMALVLGTSGIGLLSLLRQTRQTALTLATVNGRTALVQGIASRKSGARNIYLSTTFLILLISAGLISISLFFAAPSITSLVMNKSDDATISLVRWLAVPVFLGALLAYLTGVLNGYRAIGRLALVQAIGAMASAVVAYPVARLVSTGYLLAFIWMMCISLIAGLILSLYFTWRQGWLAPLTTLGKSHFQWNAARHFFSIAGTTLSTGFAHVATLLAVRGIITHEAGLSGAGIFDVAWVLSSKYVMLILNSLGTYYLPTLSQTENAKERIDLMQRLLRFVTIGMVPLVIAVVVLKPLVINILYSPEFAPSLEIIQWMLIGDFFRATAWVFGMSILAYADMKVFFWKEVLRDGFFLMGSFIALRWCHSVEWIGLSFMLLNMLNLVYLFYYARTRHQFTLTKSILIHWLVGLGLLLSASWQTWDAVVVNWSTALFWISVGAGASLLSVRRTEWKAGWEIIRKTITAHKPH